MSARILIAPLEALTDPILSDPERRVLLSLFSFRDKTTNTVWPSVESIAIRANLKDRTRVSKLTSSLAKKGWLSKKKRGFTGCNEYELSVPERLSNLDCTTTLEGKAILGGEANGNVAPETTLENPTNLDSAATSNLDSDTTSNVAPDATYKELTNEHTNEHLKDKGGKRKKSPPFDAATFDLPESVNRDAWLEWVAYRKRSRKPVSIDAARKLVKKFQKYTREQQALITDHSIEQDYQGWYPPKELKNASSTGNHVGSGFQSGPRKQTAADRLREQAKQL